MADAEAVVDGCFERRPPDAVAGARRSPSPSSAASPSGLAVVSLRKAKSCSLVTLCLVEVREPPAGWALVLEDPDRNGGGPVEAANAEDDTAQSGGAPASDRVSALDARSPACSALAATPCKCVAPPLSGSASEQD